MSSQNQVKKLQVLGLNPVPPGGNAGDVLVKQTDSDGDVAWMAPDSVEVGAGLVKADNGVISVDAVNVVEQNNTKPVTSAAVYNVIGDIESALDQIYGGAEV